MKNNFSSWIFAWTVVATVGLALACNSLADNWPQWRGADLRNVSSELSVPVEWDKETNMLWRFPMPGPAGSSPVVWGDDVLRPALTETSLSCSASGWMGNSNGKSNSRASTRMSKAAMEPMQPALRQVQMENTFGR